MLNKDTAAIVLSAAMQPEQLDAYGIEDRFAGYRDWPLVIGGGKRQRSKAKPATKKKRKAQAAARRKNR